MELILPSIDSQNSYLEYIAKLGNKEPYPFPLDFDHIDFSAMLSSNRKLKHLSHAATFTLRSFHG